MPARPPPVPPASRCAAEGSFAGNDAADGGEQAAVGYQAHGGCNLAVERAVAIQERNDLAQRSEEHTSELQSLMRISYAVFCLKKKKPLQPTNDHERPFKNHSTKTAKSGNAM